MSEEQVRRRCLPHWDIPHATYFVTTCLHGSISAEGRLDIERYRREIERRPKPASVSEVQWMSDSWKLGFRRTDEWLDLKPGATHLANPRLARIVVDALHHFADVRYELISFVIMPSHFHWVFRPIEAWFDSQPPSDRTPRERITHSINRFTATACNEALGTTGQFWQHESYDHWVRDDDELERIAMYVEGNPVKAGLVATVESWEFSSAATKRARRDTL